MGISDIILLVIENNDVFSGIAQEDIAPGAVVFTLRKNVALVEMNHDNYSLTFDDGRNTAVMEIVFKDKDSIVTEFIVQETNREIKIFLMTDVASDKNEITTIV